MSRFWVETKIVNDPKPVRELGPDEARARKLFERETVGTRDYLGLPADGNIEEIRLVEEFEHEPGSLYPRYKLRDLVVRFCARCTHLGNDACAEAAEEIKRRLAP